MNKKNDQVLIALQLLRQKKHSHIRTKHDNVLILKDIM